MDLSPLVYSLVHKTFGTHPPSGQKTKYNNFGRLPTTTNQQGWQIVGGDFTVPNNVAPSKLFQLYILRHFPGFATNKKNHSFVYHWSARVPDIPNVTEGFRIYITIEETEINYLVDTASLILITDDPNWKSAADARIDSIRKNDITMK